MGPANESHFMREGTEAQGDPGIPQGHSQHLVGPLSAWRLLPPQGPETDQLGVVLTISPKALAVPEQCLEQLLRTHSWGPRESPHRVCLSPQEEAT